MSGSWRSDPADLLKRSGLFSASALRGPSSFFADLFTAGGSDNGAWPCLGSAAGSLHPVRVNNEGSTEAETAPEWVGDSLRAKRAGSRVGPPTGSGALRRPPSLVFGLVKREKLLASARNVAGICGFSDEVTQSNRRFRHVEAPLNAQTATRPLGGSR